MEAEALLDDDDEEIADDEDDDEELDELLELPLLDPDEPDPEEGCEGAGRLSLPLSDFGSAFGALSLLGFGAALGCAG